MAKRLETRRKLNSGVNNKIDKTKLEAQEREIQKTRLLEQQALQAQQNEELKILEHQLREKRLKPTCAMLSELSRKKYEYDQMYRDELDWKHRIQCDGTPNPRVVQELNTYLFVWRQVNHGNENKNSYVDKCLEIFNIMDAVDEIVDLPLDFNQYKLQCFREVRDNLGRLLVEIVYGACYHLLSDYERRMDPVDLETVAYQNSCEAFAVGLYTVCHRPRLRTDDRPPPKCDFPECLVMVEVPPQLSQQHMAIMALWLRWDPFIDRMSEFEASKSLELDSRDLWQYSLDMWEERTQILKDLNEEKKRIEKELWMSKMEKKLKTFAEVDRSNYPEDLKAYIEELEENDKLTSIIMNESVYEKVQDAESEHPDEVEIKDETQKSEDNKSPNSANTELKKTPSQIIEEKQLEQMEKISNSLKYPEKPNELNPRRYWIIGGAFNVEMWKLPMQPVEHKDGTVVVMHVGPSALQPIDYHEKYEPLQLSMGFSSTSSEDEETDVKKQNQEALKRLMLVSIKLPENVLWFENPKPAMWNDDKKIWTTDYIYDVRFNEEKQTVSFRAGRMGSFGLAVNRYSNFPFQSWEVRPEGGAGGTGVILSVTAATVLMEFAVRGDHAAMVQLQNATTVALQEMIGAFHRPDKLVRLLRRGGVGLFPEPDARHYVDGRRPPKHAAAERHAYRCMAALSGTHQFAASRWNVHVPVNRIVLQMKEIPAGGGGGGGGGNSGNESVGGGGGAAAGGGGGGGGQGVPFKMVMVTPERAVLLKCNEVSQAFSEEPADDGLPFAPDLFTLAADAATSDRVRLALADVVDFKTVETLYYLMDKIKFLSYS